MWAAISASRRIHHLNAAELRKWPRQVAVGQLARLGGRRLLGFLLSTTENRSHHAPVTSAVKNRHDPKRYLVRCVGDEILVAHDMESQRSRGQVRASVSDVWGGNERAEGGEDVVDYAVGSVDVVFGDVFLNLVNVGERFGMEGVTVHASERRCALFSRSRRNASSPSIGFTRSLFRSS